MQRPDPVVGLGQASRTKEASRGSPGSGKAGQPGRSRAIEQAQPIAPVPVATMTPLELWRSLADRHAIR